MDSLVYRFRSCMFVLSTDWNSRTAPKSSLDRSYLKMTSNAFADGQFFNPYVSVRDGAPFITNNLQVPPKTTVKKKSLQQVLFSRVVQCKYYFLFNICQITFLI